MPTNVAFVVAWVALFAAMLLIVWLTARLAAGEALRRRRYDHPSLGKLVLFPPSKTQEQRIKRQRKSAG